MKTNKCALDYLKLKEELEKENMVIETVRSRRNRTQKLTYIYLKSMYIKYFIFVDGEGYYSEGEETCVNVYCGDGDTKYGAWFRNFRELVDELKKINKLG
ncbi:hypothetical protein P5609_012540 [Bacillus licheniformis]|uniref:hypothetical protein n=1 Tax=Bacillus licheniformis TaxID=1402 RepID=UPI00018C8C9F|nr:hypothetical protein [Bacillus licheniformis]MBW7632573.1 hypothetical protein [Bacillus licheniformis]MDH3163818.1 hypothetical protein [Bacillus licheniformis]MED4409611.1 hypothetical protein [Bacillus licheniformis]QDL80043.1 hypothetical protein D9Y32_22795 [Bacillus licheniformis]